MACRLKSRGDVRIGRLPLTTPRWRESVRSITSLCPSKCKMMLNTDALKQYFIVKYVCFI